MKVITTRLNNGLTIATQKILESESVTTGLWIKSGSRNESIAEHGLAHMLEHMAFKGTKKRSARDIAQEIEDVGGEINASTSVEITGYFSHILPKDTDLAVEILSDIICNPVFDSQELEKEKHVVLQEIGSNNDNPSDIIFDHFMQVAFKDQAIGRPILGTAQSLQTFQPKDFKNFMAKHYYAENMVFAGVGAVDHDKFVKSIEKYLGKLPQKQEKYQIKPAEYIGGRIIDPRPLMDAQIVMGFEGCTYLQPHFYTAQLLSLILGGGMSSRLFQNIREKLGLCYSIYAFHWGFSDNGIFGISASTNKEGLEQLIKTIVKEIQLLTNDISENELKRAVAQYKAAIIMSHESSSARAPTIARQLLTYGEILSNQQIFKEIDNITITDIKKLSEKIFFNSKPSIAAVGPVENLLSTEELSNLLAQ